MTMQPNSHPPTSAIPAAPSTAAPTHVADEDALERAAADNAYVHPTLDRQADLRRDPQWMDRVAADPQTRLVPVWQAKSLISGSREAPYAILPASGSVPWREAARPVAVLGVDAGVTYLAVEVADDADLGANPVAALGAFVDLRRCGPLMRRDEAALLAYARAVVWFQKRHRFCGGCGAPMETTEAGYARRCPSCAMTVYPRLDPAVIVLVHDGGDRVLLARAPHFPPGMHSVLAGFVEAGESFESTIRREIHEEAGVLVDDIRYESSQPWPFPQSLMVGFRARATTLEITRDPEELAEADWYTRDWLRANAQEFSLEGDAFKLPRRDSIARRLLEEWLAEG